MRNLAWKLYVFLATNKLLVQRTKKEKIMTEEFKGFSLFNDIEDAELRNRNRGVVLANIATNHSKKGKVSPGAAGLILGYFDKVPGEDRGSVTQYFQSFMAERGFSV